MIVNFKPQLPVNCVYFENEYDHSTVNLLTSTALTLTLTHTPTHDVYVETIYTDTKINSFYIKLFVRAFLSVGFVLICRLKKWNTKKLLYLEWLCTTRHMNLGVRPLNGVHTTAVRLTCVSPQPEQSCFLPLAKRLSAPRLLKKPTRTTTAREFLHPSSCSPLANF